MSVGRTLTPQPDSLPLDEKETFDRQDYHSDKSPKRTPLGVPIEINPEPMPHLSGLIHTVQPTETFRTSADVKQPIAHGQTNSWLFPSMSTNENERYFNNEQKRLDVENLSPHIDQITEDEALIHYNISIKRLNDRLGLIELKALSDFNQFTEEQRKILLKVVTASRNLRDDIIQFKAIYDHDNLKVVHNNYSPDGKLESVTISRHSLDSDLEPETYMNSKEKNLIYATFFNQLTQVLSPSLDLQQARTNNANFKNTANFLSQRMSLGCCQKFTGTVHFLMSSVMLGTGLLLMAAVFSL